MPSFNDIKAGDRIWLGYARNAHQSLETVARITLALIVLEGTGNRRYERNTGRRYGYSSTGAYVTGVATPEECTAWDEKIKRDGVARLQRAADNDRQNTTVQKLCGLFPGQIYVTTAEFRGRGLYDVIFPGLTESQVRDLAGAVVQSKYEDTAQKIYSSLGKK